jgi:hypothetical protein
MSISRRFTYWCRLRFGMLWVAEKEGQLDRSGRLISRRDTRGDFWIHLLRQCVDHVWWLMCEEGPTVIVRIGDAKSEERGEST